MELVAEPASDVCTFGVLVAALEAADSTAATRSEGEHAAHLASVKAEVDRCGARLENLLDGSTLAVLAGRSAADAIACARVLRAHHPDQPILVAQGASTGAMSAALERALVAQERGELEALFAPPAPGQRRPPDAIGIADGMAAALTGALTPLRDAQGAYLSGVETGVRLAPPDAPDGQ
jgi:hypothetical protein